MCLHPRQEELTQERDQLDAEFFPVGQQLKAKTGGGAKFGLYHQRWSVASGREEVSKNSPVQSRAIIYLAVKDDLDGKLLPTLMIETTNLVVSWNFDISTVKWFNWFFFAFWSTRLHRSRTAPMLRR